MKRDGLEIEPAAENAGLLHMLLHEQQDLPAVERFARRDLHSSGPTQARYYRDLLPLAEPREAEQYAFEVDLDACSGCKACVTACHRLNGLEEGEAWRSVGLLHGGATEAPVLQHVTSACHHCLEPACLHGCPVNAYEKDERTGIVRHLDDQCIGCQYCMLTCPYDVPKYSHRLGIVRKCDMCHGRLAAGEAPACVQSCPNQAIRITLVSRQGVVEESEANLFLPGAPEPRLTLPTTIYRTQKPLPRNLLPADYHSARPGHAHLALVFMLVLTQMSVGAFVVGQVLVNWGPVLAQQDLSGQMVDRAAALSVGLIGLLAAVFHLGRPRYAHRAVLGWRTSWLSREIICFGLFAFFATLYALAPAWPSLASGLRAPLDAPLGVAAAVAGIAGVACSVMIYVVTRRPFWSAGATGLKFAGTAACLGIPLALFFAVVSAALEEHRTVADFMGQRGAWLCRWLMAAVIAKLLLECLPFVHLRQPQHTPLKRTAELMVGELGLTTFKRFFLGLAGGVALPGMLAAESTLTEGLGFHPLFIAIVALLSTGLLVAGELLERHLFFKAVVAPKMPRIACLVSKPASETQSCGLPSKPSASWLRQIDGPLTAELLLAPGRFGLGKLPAGKQPDATTVSICGYCSTGCGLNVHLREGQAINLTPATDYPVNLGMACPKGWEALAVLEAKDRATTPLARDARGKLVPVSWDAALRLFCERFKRIGQQHGEDSIAFVSTGQIPTEEMAFLGCLAKFGMGMLHGDGNTRQCMATAVVAYKEAFGFDAPPYTYADLEESDVIVLVGSNLCVAHPILWQRVLRNPHNPQIIVIDPRRTETAMAATLHLAICPKSDLALFYGIAHILLREGWIDEAYIRDHTNGFLAFAEHVRGFNPARVAAASGLPESTLRRVARMIHEGRRVSFWWTMGVNQSYEGVRTAQAIINLALLTGNLGRPGAGANSITGQCNAMGSRLFSNTTNLLGGHDFTNAEDRSKVAGALQIDAARIPSCNSWAYPEIVEGILRGRIKGLWVIATNPAHSWINQNTFRDVLSRLDFLVVQDMYHTTETAQRADLVLPAAGWGEKEGTFINSERRIGLIKKVARAPGQALADFQIFRLIAEFWGCGEMFRCWTSPEAVFQILKEVSRGQPCDISGIEDYAMLDAQGGIQWPYPAGTASAEVHRRLFADGKFFHGDGKARFIFEDPRQMPEPVTAKFPYLLLTGRASAAQWHTETRTAKSAVLEQLSPRGVYVEINPQDARREGIYPNQDVIVESQRGRLKAKAFVTYSVRPGQVFVPMHYHEANRLTHAHFDPYSRQPSYKDCAVRVRPAQPHDV